MDFFFLSFSFFFLEDLAISVKSPIQVLIILIILIIFIIKNFKKKNEQGF